MACDPARPGAVVACGRHDGAAVELTRIEQRAAGGAHRHVDAGLCGQETGGDRRPAVVQAAGESVPEDGAVRHCLGPRGGV